MIGARLSDPDVIFTVEDNGVVIHAAEIEGILLGDSKGYGLSNVQQRIRHYYGEAYGLTIQSRQGQGTTVTGRIPQR